VPLVVGIDEAGYGPTLGPLVVGATLWSVEPRLVKADYWKLLGDCVTRAVRPGQWRLPVDDSKSVYQRSKGLSTLERSVLAFASAAGLDCTTFGNLLTGLGVQLSEGRKLPWYRDLSRPALPTDPARSRFDGVSQHLKRTMSNAGVRCCGLSAAVVTEDFFNRRVAATRNKAAVLVEHVLRLIQLAGERAGKQDLVLRADRLGGRTNYRELLSLAFPDRHLHIIGFSEKRSRYRLASARNDWFVEFSVDADEQYLPVALASMLAKYLREVLMGHFNAYWKHQLPTLRPTAGYYTDAHRFLTDIEPVLGEAGVPREHFVRAR
jgi:hypothetical protein